MQQAPVIPRKTPVMGIFCESSFTQLSDAEKHYAYYFTQASWEGGLTCYFQQGKDGPALYLLWQLVFGGQSFAELKQLSGVSDEDFESFLAYASSVLANCSNYFGFGDKKFIPDLPEEQFHRIVKSSRNYQSSQWRNVIDELLDYLKDGLYNYQGLEGRIATSYDGGLTGYYSPNITKEELDATDELLVILNISALNTRVLKEKGSEKLKVLVMCANHQPLRVHHYTKGDKTYLVEVHYGHLSNIMRKVAENLSAAIPYAANINQKNMLKAYVEHFYSGLIETHKDSQRWWIKDVGPVVETNIGFIETYHDPKQVRAEFEGMVSVVDKTLSKQVDVLVSQATDFISLLPWPKEFEKDTFIRPDFTSLNVLAFSGTGTPLGINIPNYDDIRQEEGFKNVYLGNAMPSIKEVLFFDEADAQLMIKYSFQSSFHKVIYHELLGHGSGKLFQLQSDGTKNYDPSTLNPVTGSPVGEQCYAATDTWNSKFQNLSNPYEECRADTVALFFANFQKAFAVLQPDFVEHWEDIRDVNYLEFVYQAIIGLQFYNVEAQKWGQAHINGRWVILSVLLEAGHDMIQIEKIQNAEGKDWVSVKFKRELFKTVGFEAISKFLTKLQVLKAIGDVESAKEFFGNYSKVSQKFVEIREIVLNNKKPRRLELHANLVKDGGKGKITYKQYPETFEGLIQSHIDRDPLFNTDFYQQWKSQAETMKAV